MPAPRMQRPAEAGAAWQEFGRLVALPGLDRLEVARRSMIGANRGAPPFGTMGLVSFGRCGEVRDHGNFQPGQRGRLIDIIRATRIDTGTPLGYR